MLEIPPLSTTLEAEEIIFTMEETEEDPFFFKHDSLLPYRQEVCLFFLGIGDVDILGHFFGGWRFGDGGGMGCVVWGRGVLGLFSMRAQGVLEE